jgi:hypothetical protein
MSLRVLDVNNPETILVDPPKPDWMKNLEKKSKETKKNKNS